MDEPPNPPIATSFLLYAMYVRFQPEASPQSLSSVCAVAIRCRCLSDIFLVTTTTRTHSLPASVVCARIIKVHAISCYHCGGSLSVPWIGHVSILACVLRLLFGCLHGDFKSSQTLWLYRYYFRTNPTSIRHEKWNIKNSRFNHNYKES